MGSEGSPGMRLRVCGEQMRKSRHKIWVIRAATVKHWKAQRYPGLMSTEQRAETRRKKMESKSGRRDGAVVNSPGERRGQGLDCGVVRHAAVRSF